MSAEAVLKSYKDVLKENKCRIIAMTPVFDPLTGEGSHGLREKLSVKDYCIPEQWLPVEMFDEPLVQRLQKTKTVKALFADLKKEAIKYGMDKEDADIEYDYNEDSAEEFREIFTRLRIKYDFAFWCVMFVMIHPKGSGIDVPFRLNRQQRRLVSKMEAQRKAGKPIRIVLAKSRQWGGSTVTQIYIAWLQLVHCIGANSIIVGHQKDSSAEVEDMYKKLIESYPIKYMFNAGDEYDEKMSKWAGDPHTGNIHHVPPRQCKVKIGTAEKPDSARGGDSVFVHCTEVAFWKKTEGKRPEDIIRAACAGALPKPMTLIVYESSPNGSGNFFQREYDAAKAGQTIFDAMFVPWWDIETYQIAFASEDEKANFAIWLWEHRNDATAPDVRHESGRYLWWLFEIGAPLEAINWYIAKRSEFSDHADMASEYPSDDVEAFTYAGARVFDKYKVNLLKPTCKPPLEVGEVQGFDDEGKGAFKDLKFIPDPQGLLQIWEHPEVYPDEIVKNRYVVVVDIGGRSSKADYSVIVVFDRYWMIEGDKPVVVAQWYGHIDMDLLAWKAGQIAAYYDNAYLIIESNTLETHDKERQVDGDQSHYILNVLKDVYPNLYYRAQSDEEIAEGAPRKYGFHTNVATKPKIISTLVKVIRETLYVERDARVLDEYLEYEKKPNGAYGAIIGKHDDLLMTRAIGLHVILREMDAPCIITREQIEKTKLTITKRATAISAATL